MNTQDLLNAGYRFYPGSRRQFCDGCWHRAFKDGIGIRYGLEMWHYPAICDVPETYQCELTIDDPHFTLTLHRVTNLKYAESYMNKAWVMLGLPYYETLDKDQKPKAQERPLRHA